MLALDLQPNRHRHTGYILATLIENNSQDQIIVDSLESEIRKKKRESNSETAEK